MGCVCGKPSAIEDSRESPRDRPLTKGPSELDVSRVSSSRRRESFRLKDKLANGDARVTLIDKKANGSMRLKADHAEKKREKSDLTSYDVISTIPKAIEGEQVVAGWPSWLATVAGEAIRGWLPRRADTFEKLAKIGQGTYSNVYKARDILNNKIVALKRVRFDNLDPESVKFMAREIVILRRLDHPNIVKLEGIVTSRMSCSLYLVMEYMEHDLTGLVSLPGIKFTEPQIKCYMQQLLSGLDHCHSRGVLHRDIKGSNLLIDDGGILKIADFGLASFFDPRLNLPLTSRVVTLWYRPPELLLGATHYGVAVDLWSAGCILAELYTGKPIMPGRTEVEQLHKIFKLCGSPAEDYWRKSKLPHSTVFKPQQPYKRCISETFKDFPSPAVGLIETLLSVDPGHRGTASLALKSEFFTTKPLACNPSNLPKYPPSKEIDAKLRDEEARRQRAAGGRVQRVDQDRRGARESRANPAPNANAEMAVSMQKRKSHSNTNSRSEIFIQNHDESASGFPIDPPRLRQGIRETNKDLLEQHHKKLSCSGPLVHGLESAKAGRKPPISTTGANLSTLSGLVAARTFLPEDSREHSFSLLPVCTNGDGKYSRLLNEPESTRKQEQKYQPQSTASFRQIEDAKIGRPSTKESGRAYGSKGNQIHFSGPILGPSNNVDQMLKEHDRQIQEAARRARSDKIKLRKA